MVKCVCGKDISSVPSWLADVSVQFVCNNCPNRSLRGITQVDFSSGKIEEAPPAKMVEGEEEADVDNEADETED